MPLLGNNLFSLGYLSIYCTVSQSIPDNTGTSVFFNRELQDDLDAWNIANPYNIKIPNGVNAMRLTAHLEWTINSVGYRSLRYLINGGQASAPYRSLSDVRLANGVISDHSNITGGIMGCVPGDILTISCRHNSGVILTTLPANNASTTVFIEWYNGL